MPGRRVTGGLFLVLGVATVEGAVWAGQVTVWLRPERFVTCWQDSTFRGRDIADNDYREGFFSGPYGPFSGYHGRQVILTYERTGGAFRGRLVARGLKPYFAYQMKLVGRPSREFGRLGDDATNERLGRTGRWWRKGPNEGNVYDWSYENSRNDPQAILVGYLIFDYFVTDRYGNATKDFAACHSIHAFWETRSTEATGTGQEEGSLRRAFLHRVQARRSSGYGYDRDYPDCTVSIRLEIERFEEGTMVLPPGDYDSRFLLTEESFHQRGQGGYWQSALVADRVRFSIRDYVAPPVILSPAGDSPVPSRLVLQGLAEPTEVIQVFADSSREPLATARSGPTGRWRASLRLPAGRHCLHAVAHCGARRSRPGKAVVVTVGPQG
jgi:hypothetical protein